MTMCSTCGNDYDQSFRVTTHSGESLVFDSIECAAQRIAPRCAHCQCQVLGHGIQHEGTVFCCAHCAANSGVVGATDSVAGGS